MSSKLNNDRYADVVLPLALQKLYTYRIPGDLDQEVFRGGRVVVSFGKSKIYTALVHSVHHSRPEHYTAKPVLEALDNIPVVNEQQFKLWEWISEYYLCTLGEIMIAALPSELKLQSETVVTLNPAFEPESQLLTEEELQLIEHLKESSKLFRISDAVKYSGSKSGIRMVREMIERGILLVSEELRDAFVPRKKIYVKLSAKAQDDAFMQEVFSKIEKRASRQLELLMTYLKLQADQGVEFLARDFLLKSSHSSMSILKQLVARDVFELFESDEHLAALPSAVTSAQIALSEVQQKAYELLTEFNSQHKTSVLHGVTSSGKTEVYIRLISDLIQSGKQVLYLLPEIALTTQIISRLKGHFGESMLVYHSRFGARERAEVYMKLVKDGTDGTFRYPIVIGARSAVFLPFKNTGLVIVDEEHDQSYKQHDPAPRYNARDVAVVYGGLNKCGVILGSATPSLESFFNAETGKYELVRMNERYGGLQMPEIKIIDLKEAYRKRKMRSYFTQELLDNIKTALDNRNQVILFQNRRGFATVIECKNCGWIPHCINCDVTLTYHKRSNHLRCHYCGYTTPPPAKCNACNDPDLRMRGIGTERIEDEIAIFFPDHKVERLDLDTGSSKSAYQRIISGFEQGEVDILVGTQMVTKGLDFNNVSLVGVINADSLINFPDFRAVERSYQLLAQVAGRSGRKFRRGQVLVQTFQTTHPMLDYLIRNDFEGYYRYELAERQKYFYPPYFRLIHLKLKHRDEKEVELLSQDFTKILKQVFGKRVLGPVTPPVSRVRNFYLKNIMLKMEKTLPNHEVKQKLTRVINRFLSQPENRSLFIQTDVDPM